MKYEHVVMLHTLKLLSYVFYTIERGKLCNLLFR